MFRSDLINDLRIYATAEIIKPERVYYENTKSREGFVDSGHFRRSEQAFATVDQCLISLVATFHKRKTKP